MAENWLRWHVGTATDPKWRVVARRSGQPIHVVLAIWATMLETACNAVKRGKLEGWSSEDQAAALDLDPEQIDAVYAAMQGKVLEGDLVVSWDRRQPKREDISTDRVRAFRERQASLKDVGNADETNETRGNARGEEIREEKKEPPNPPSKDQGFKEFYDAYPNHVGPGHAMKAWKAAVKKADPATLQAAAVAFAAKMAGTEKRFIAHPATWLNGERWLDEGIAPQPPAPNDIVERAMSVAFNRGHSDRAMAMFTARQSDPATAETMAKAYLEQAA